MKRIRTPSSIATELSLIGSSLESIERDLLRANVPDEWTQGFSAHIADRLSTVESLLQAVRMEVVRAGVKAKK